MWWGYFVMFNLAKFKVRDQQRLEEFGTGPNLRSVALFSEELFLVQVAKSKSAESLLLSLIASVQKGSAAFGNILGLAKAGNNTIKFK